MKLLKYSLLPLSILVLVLLLIGAQGNDVVGIRQPIQFNHSLHTEEWELDCDMCHRYVLEEEYAGRPSVEICAVCHEDPLSDSPAEAILGEYIRTGEKIPWRRLYDVPSHVFYSHRRHVAVAQIECVECHGEIGSSTSPPERPLNELSMEFCLDCHESENITTSCNA